MFYQIQIYRTQTAEMTENDAVLSLVTLTFDLLDRQTCPSEGPNTSSAWIWRKSVVVIHKQKQTDGAKNRTFRISLRAAKS